MIVGRRLWLGRRSPLQAAPGRAPRGENKTKLSIIIIKEEADDQSCQSY
jgi:hypothetical protein